MRGGLRSLSLYLALGAVGVFFIPNLPPSELEFESRVIEPVPLTGGMAPNKRMEEPLQNLSSKVKGAQLGVMKVKHVDIIMLNAITSFLSL